MKLEGPNKDGQIKIKKDGKEVGKIEVTDHGSGMASFDLNINEGNMHKGFAAEAVRLLLTWFKGSGYKDISTVVDDKNPYGEYSKKILGKTGFGFAGHNKGEGSTSYYKNLKEDNKPDSM